MSGPDFCPHRALRDITLHLLLPVALFVAFTASLILPNLTEALSGANHHQSEALALRLHGVADSPGQWIALWFLAGLVFWAWLPPLVSWVRLSLLLRHLWRVGERRRVLDLVAEHRRGQLTDREIVVVPGAWIGLVGVFRPTLVVGEVLLTGLRETELAAALAHEEAHARARHPRKRLLLLIVSRMLPVFGRRLLGRWTEAAEVDCDQSAARVVGDPAWVASAMLATHRLQRAAVNAAPRLKECPVALGFASPDLLARRVQRLLELPKRELAHVPKPTRRVWLLFAVVSLVVIVMHAPLHHAVERMLGIIH